MEEHLNLDHLTNEDILEIILNEFEDFLYDPKKHQIQLLNSSGDLIGYVRLPLHWLIDENLNLLSEDAMVVYLSIESGNAALSVMEGEENTYHTTFSAYMTRKKQGFSQIKYLNKKGKSRAGSRVRLAETTTFFENINTTLNELWEEFTFDRLALNCNKTLLPYLLQSKVPFPIDKQDPMLYKIPLHIPQSNFTNLDMAIEKLKTPLLLYNEEYAKKISCFR